MLKNFVIFYCLLLLIPIHTWAATKEINIYSARKEALIKPLLDQFSAESGIKVNLVTAKGDALLTRLKSEGVNSPADLLVTTDVGRLHRAKEANVLQPLENTMLKEVIAENFRDPEGYWFGLSLRSRVIVYAPERVKKSDLLSYEDLAQSKWRKRICR